MQVEPKDRPTAKEILENDFLKNSEIFQPLTLIKSEINLLKYNSVVIKLHKIENKNKNLE